MSLYIVYIVVGVLLLYWGAGRLLQSSVQIAFACGMSPLVIGLTLIALATSVPEALTSTIAQIQREPGDVALGNVFGSNIANVGLVLGVALLILPIRVPEKIKLIEMPILLLFSLILAFTIHKGFIGWWTGVCFLVLTACYLIFEWFCGKEGEPVKKAKGQLVKNILFFLLSMIALIFGAKGLVDGGVGVARILKVPERVIAVTVIAIGTSLPELVTVIIAAARKKDLLVLGNVVGSNILNLLLIVGLSATIRPLILSHDLFHKEVPIMIGFSAILWLSMLKWAVLPRMLGVLYLVLYLAYLLFVVI